MRPLAAVAWRAARRVGPSAAHSIADQAMVSLTNLGINLLLARSLDEEAFGSYAIAFAGFLLVGLIHSAIVIEPMLVNANGLFKGRALQYLRELRTLNWGLSAVVSSPLAVAAGIAAILRSSLTVPLLVFAVASTFILYHWTARRACYAMLRPGSAARADFAYMLVVACGAGFFAIYGHFGIVQSVVVMAVASAIAGTLGFRMLLAPASSGSAIGRVPILTVHWQFGKWLLASAAFRWLQGNAILIVAPALIGMTAAAELRVLGLAIMPILQVLAAVGSLLAPVYTRSLSSGYIRTVRSATLALALLAAIYYAILLVFGEQILVIAFGETYSHLGVLLAIIGLAPIMSAVNTSLGAALAAALKTDFVFRATALSSVVAVVATFVAVPRWGVLGAVSADVLASIALGIASWFWLDRVLRRAQ